ncbi:unnamed protein product [Paramecium pentaurelia]|uniref:Uncharacterized protein n=1 Tax=Paramecium pentaurelia TaxID=43138 RepID=A0A8S1TFK6_9CILI|nr:unnamed protein product [Paramecium pentaurelia]
MSNSLTQFQNSFQLKSIEQLFNCEKTDQNQDIYSEIISNLASDFTLINQKFVIEWIQFTKKLQNLLIEAEVKLKRAEMVGTKTTYQLVHQDQVSLNLQQQQISDIIKNLQSQIEKKKINIPNLDSEQIKTAKFENDENIKYIEKLLQKLNEYNMVLLKQTLNPTYSFQVESYDVSQIFSDETTFRTHQQQQQISNLDTFKQQE